MLSCPPLFVGGSNGAKDLANRHCTCAIAACDNSKPKAVVYTLYRNSPTVVGTISGVDARIRVATFDAAESTDYNRKNCEFAH